MNYSVAVWTSPTVDNGIDGIVLSQTVYSRYNKKKLIKLPSFLSIQRRTEINVTSEPKNFLLLFLLSYAFLLGEDFYLT